MFLGLVLAANLQIGFTLPVQLQGADCTPDARAGSLMTAHARLLDGYYRFVAEDSVADCFPGDTLHFSWPAPSSEYCWVEVWASNPAGTGCLTRQRLKIFNAWPAPDTLPKFAAPFLTYEVFDVTGRRVSRGLGQWSPSGVGHGVYWVRRGSGRQAIVKKVILR